VIQAAQAIDKDILSKVRAEAEKARLGGYDGKAIEGEVAGKSPYMTAMEKFEAFRRKNRAQTQ
jgi:hypothetical protein